ncbi:MAG TPA: DinB family protein [Chitinophagaceae bacterium]|nr:DinB family protein [Chitinophagaceae bacterium]
MKLLLSLLLFLCCLSLAAQDSLSISLKQQMLKDWQRAKAYTQEYLNAMPADKYNFRPVDSVRSFAEQMLHFARANAGFAAIGTGFRSPALLAFYNPNFGQSPTSQSKDSVVYYVTTSYDIAIEAIKSLDVAKFNEMVSFNLPGGNRTASRLVWIMKAFEHQTHHRGQCTVYLRLVGVTPPAEKLWE